MLLSNVFSEFQASQLWIGGSSCPGGRTVGPPVEGGVAETRLGVVEPHPASAQTVPDGGQVVAARQGPPQPLECRIGKVTAGGRVDAALVPAGEVGWQRLVADAHEGPLDLSLARRC